MTFAFQPGFFPWVDLVVLWLIQCFYAVIVVRCHSVQWCMGTLAVAKLCVCRQC